MSSLTDLTNETRPQTIKSVSIVYAYAFGLVLMYEGSFWATFHINIMEYSSLSDLPKIAIYPLLYATASMLLAAAFQVLLTLAQDTKSKKDVLDEMAQPSQIPNHIETGSKRFNIIRHLTSRQSLILHFILSYFIIGALITSIELNKEPSLILLLLLLYPACIFSYYISNHTQFLKAEVDNDKIRFVLIIFAILLFPLIFIKALFAAELIKDGYRYEYITSSQIPEICANLAIKPDVRLRYIGRTTDYVFFYHENIVTIRSNKGEARLGAEPTTIIIRAEKLNQIALAHEEK